MYMRIVYVTSLADTGPGTLRSFSSLSNVTIRTKIVGWIRLASNLTFSGNRQHVDLSGLGIRDQRVNVSSKNSKFYNLRIRSGTQGNPQPDFGNLDCLYVMPAARNNYFYNCSFSYSSDETVSVYGQGNYFYDCIIAYGMADAGHPEGDHARAVLVNPPAQDTAFIRCIIAHHTARNPLFRSGDCLLLNCVVFGYRLETTSINANDAITRAEFINNVFIRSKSSTREQPPIRLTEANNWIEGSAAYVRGNLGPRRRWLTLPETDIIYVNERHHASLTPLNVLMDQRKLELPTLESIAHVRRFAGALPNDDIDIQLKNDLLKGIYSERGIINTELDMPSDPYPVIPGRLIVFGRPFRDPLETVT